MWLTRLPREEEPRAEWKGRSGILAGSGDLLLLESSDCLVGVLGRADTPGSDLKYPPLSIRKSKILLLDLRNVRTLHDPLFDVGRNLLVVTEAPGVAATPLRQ